MIINCTQSLDTPLHAANSDATAKTSESKFIGAKAQHSKGENEMKAF